MIISGRAVAGAALPRKIVFCAAIVAVPGHYPAGLVPAFMQGGYGIVRKG
jgi:hypothetical protein